MDEIRLGINVTGNGASVVMRVWLRGSFIKKNGMLCSFLKIIIIYERRDLQNRQF